MARDSTTIAAACAVVTVTALPVFLTGSLAVQVRADLGFDESALGLTVGMFFGVAALGSSPSGRLAERLGPSAGMRVSSALAALSLGGVALLARNYALLLVFLAVGGLANAAAHPSSNLFLARKVDPRRLGVALGAKQASVPAANLLAGLAVPVIALTAGWRWAYAAGACIALALVVLPPGGGVEPPARGGGARRGPGDTALRSLLLLAVAAGLGSAASGTLVSFLVSSAVDSGIRAGDAGLLASVCSGIGLSARVTLGLHADRRGRDQLRVVIAMLALGSVGYFLISTQDVVGVMFGALVAYGLGWSWPGLFNLAVVRNNPGAPAAATGITQTGTFVGAVCGPLLFGNIVEQTSYTVAWTCAGATSLAAALAVTLGRTRLRVDQERRRVLAVAADR